MKPHDDVCIGHTDVRIQKQDFLSFFCHGNGKIHRDVCFPNTSLSTDHCIDFHKSAFHGLHFFLGLFAELLKDFPP